MKRILSIVMMLAIAFSLAIGTAVVSNAATGEFAGASATLTDGITVQMGFKMTEAEFTSATAQVGTKDAYAVEKKDVTFANVEGTDMALVPVEIAVKDIEKEIKVVVNGTYTGTTTASAYFDTLTSDAKYSGIASALKLYSAAAVSYFANDDSVAVPDQAPNFGTTEMERGGTLSGLKHRSATLILESATTIRHYFELNGGNIDNYTFYVDLDLDGGYDADEELVYGELDGAYYVDIKGITPNDLDKQYTLYVEDGTNKYFCTYGALDYASRKYNQSGATNSTKALMGALNDYRLSANAVTGNLIYKDADKTAVLKNATYREGTVNYLDYLPEKAGYTFAGWVDASGNAQNAVPANQSGDFTVYAKWAKNSAKFLSGNYAGYTYSDTLSTMSNIAAILWGQKSDGTFFSASPAIGNLSGVTKTVSGDYTLIDYTSYTQSSTSVFTLFGDQYGQDSYNWMNKFTSYDSSASSYTVKFTWNLGKDGTKDCVNFAFSLYNSTKSGSFFTVDGGWQLQSVGDYVYLGGKNVGNKEYAIAKLTSDGLTPVTAFFEFTDVNATAGTAKVVASAYNLEGKKISLPIQNCAHETWGTVGTMVWGTGANVATQPYALKVGNLNMDIVSTGTAPAINRVVDQNGNFIATYDSFKATRLPTPVYLDAEGKQEINSVPAGYTGEFKVYQRNITTFVSTTPNDFASGLTQSGNVYTLTTNGWARDCLTNDILTETVTPKNAFGDKYYLKCTMELGAVAGVDAIDTAFQIGNLCAWNMRIQDGKVYLGPNEGNAAYEIAALEDGKLSEITLYYTLTSVDNTNDKANISVSAYNASGELLTVNLGVEHIGPGTGVNCFLGFVFGAGSQPVGAKLMMGDITASMVNGIPAK